MTDITRDTVLHLAKLSSLQLTDSEIDSLTSDLSRIIEYITQLDQLDTDGIEPTYEVTGLENVFRDDEVKPGLSREQLLTLAPDSHDGSIKVPKVL
ncbi:MAG TPA: Asp-tRNA(Asn)/Glu-tRNA(Gln) amidotransferase subunit GatC [Candidatus Saccharibacteria bacterium]|nr:Asp-tRNA(Asn)/Glu-tRNA(Gln) amidotransferase subunit GatC [Candidatus Saccharibacteria bacterium]